MLKRILDLRDKDNASFIGLVLLQVEILLVLFPRIGAFQVLGYTVRLFHVFPIVFLPFVIKQLRSGKLALPPLLLFILLGIATLVTLLNASTYGVDEAIATYWLIFFMTIVVLNLSAQIEKEHFQGMFCVIAIVFGVAVLVKTALSANEIIAFFADPKAFHPSGLHSFSMGGSNIEASWLALLGVFTISYPIVNGAYLGGAFFISMAYSTRAGFLCILLVMLWCAIHTPKRKQFIIATTLGILIALGLMQIIYHLAGDDIFFSLSGRMQTVGTDPGSVGRLRMWAVVPDAFLNQWWGYGTSNAMKALAAMRPNEIFRNSNLHNLFLQHLVDHGLAGFLAFAFGVVWFCVKELKDRLAQNPFAAFFGIYLVMGMLQFKGPEMLAMIVLAVCLRTREYRGLVWQRK